MFRYLTPVVILMLCALPMASAERIVVPEDFSTIQSAIDAAMPGDTVAVSAGDYTENLEFKNGITLSGAGLEEVTVRAAKPDVPVISISGCFSGEITGITFDGAVGGESSSDAGLNTPVCRITGSAVTIRGCAFINGSGSGIHFDGQGKGVVESCKIRENARSGILVSGAGAEPVLKDNTCLSNGVSGIVFTNKAGGSAEDNDCRENGRHGISVTLEGTTPTLTANMMSGNKQYGLNVASGARPDMQDNDFTVNAQISRAEMWHLFTSGGYDDLEKIATRLRIDETRYPSGEWQLGFFYRFLSGHCDSMDEGQEDEHMIRIREWREEFPDSVVPRIVTLGSLNEFAWRERGSGFAHTVTDDGWTGFYKYLDQAWSVYEEAAALKAEDPELYAEAIKTAMGLGVGADESTGSILEAIQELMFESARAARVLKPRPVRMTRQLFDKGSELASDYYPLYRRITAPLLPRWGAAPGELEAFAERMAKDTQIIEGGALYARMAVYTLNYVGTDTFAGRFAFEWNPINDGIKHYLERYPDSRYWKNLHCRLACLYEQRETAAELFEYIGEGWDNSVWRHSYHFKTWRRWALDDGEFPFFGTTLQEAVVDGRSEEVQDFIDAGIAIDRINEHGKTMFYIALQEQQFEVATLLLKAGARTEVEVPTGRTPIRMALDQENDRMLEFLLDNGADPDFPGRNGWTALHRCAKQGAASRVRILLTHNANPEIKMEGGWRPLHVACDQGQLKVVRILLDLGVDTHAKLDSGTTAIALARRKGHKEIVDLIREHETQP